MGRSLDVRGGAALLRIPASGPDARGRAADLLAETRRIATGAVGPVAVALVQFLAAMLVWAQGSVAAFGLFSFALLLIQLSFGVSNALVGTPLAVAAEGCDRTLHRHACLSAHAIHLAIAAASVAGLLWLAGSGWAAGGFALLTVVANLRWTARADSIAEERVGDAVRSDATYAVIALPLLAVCFAGGFGGLASAIAALAFANIAALGLRSRAFLQRQRAAVLHPRLDWYRDHIWPRQAGWSLAGVISTEASSNAHAYIVTWQLGAAFYAPLALGSLFCRPVTIFLTALTQIDRPIFVRHLRGGRRDRARRLLATSRIAAIVVWGVNVAAALVALSLFHGAIVARGYDPAMLRAILALWLTIMALRSVRAPASTLIQASGRFRALALCSMASSLISVVAVLVAVRQGPAWSLVGVLGGELAFVAAVAVLARRQLA